MKTQTVIILAVVAVAVWYFMRQSSAVGPVSIDDAVKNFGLSTAQANQLFKK